jgi:histidinol-phosphate aminotransferase
MSQFWSKTVQELTPYTPGEQLQIPDLIKLNTNESPYGPSPKALEAIHSTVNQSLRLYPPPNSDELRQAIAKTYAVKESEVFISNGSDEVLAHIFLGLFKHEAPILFPDITYSFYPVYAQLYEIEVIRIPLNDKLEIQIDDYISHPNNAGIIFPNPNAPTGHGLSRSEIERLLIANPHSVVVIDEAYVDFGAESCVGLIGKYNNLIVTHSLSKSRALAGLRVGYAIGNAALIEGLNRVKDSFNSYPIDRLAQAGATAAILDKDYLQQISEKVIRSRTNLIQELSEMGFETLPSVANFVFTTHPSFSGKALYQSLRDQHILVRHFDKPRIHQFVRMTVGTEEECSKLIEALKKTIANS